MGICFAGWMSASGTAGGTDVGSAAAATTRTLRPCIFLAKIWASDERIATSDLTLLSILCDVLSQMKKFLGKPG